jgi:hypothetical protein
MVGYARLQQVTARSEQWLRDNSAQFTVVGQPT